MEEQKKKGNGGLIAALLVIIVLLIAVIVLIVLKPDLFSIKNNSTTNNNGNTSTEVIDNGTTNTEVIDNGKVEKEEIKEIDLSKSLNTTDYTYSSLNDKDEAAKYYTLKLNENKKSATITVTAEGGKVICESIKSTCGDKGYDITVSGFDKKIKSTYVGGIGQSVGSTIFYFLMEDGTVEYVKLLNQKTDSNGTNYYENGTLEKPQVVSGVSGVVKLYGANSNAPQSTGSYTTLAAKKDGSFYDLGKIIK